MALEASHIRFALDVKEKFGITNECDYVVGAIYPDSRYVTKIDRYLTHPIKEYASDPIFKQDDFRKGWFTHLLCDGIQYHLMKELFPEVLENDSEDKHGEWIKRTAIKILQDIQDANSFNVKKYLHCFSDIKNPHGENVEDIKMYHLTLQELYESPETLTTDSYNFLWNKWGLDTERGKKLIVQAKIFSEDENIMARVKGFYTKILEKAG